MQIHGVSHVHGLQQIGGPQQVRGAQPTSSPSSSAGVDQLDISSEADMLSRARDVSEIRMDRVAELRAAIEAGAYETEAKIEMAVERLLDELV